METLPEHCPGTESESAGKVDACRGCPNQNVCASARPKSPDPDVDAIADRLSKIKRKILILSGKGGVGKSTVTLMLARGLSSGHDNTNVGVLDMDLCGPSLPRAFGVEDEKVHQSGSGWSPVYVEDNLCLMSAGFLLPSLDSAVIWRGPKKNGLVKQLLKDVDWTTGVGDDGGSVDYLLIDTPPGTSDEHLSVVRYMSKAKLDGAVIVTTPQEVALLDVRKQIDFCRKVNLPILGVIENMSVFVCPKCKCQSSILPSTSGGAEKLGLDNDLPFLGRLPMDPSIGRACDEGADIFAADSPAPQHVVGAFTSIILNLCTQLAIIDGEREDKG